ncbi:MAG: amidohydrolase family protein [bacterium]|nr:amidohydrolase family protein [bacterium]
MSSETAGGTIWARHALDPALGAVAGLLIEWDGERLTRVERAPRPPAGLAAEAVHGQHLLTPGLLNAHSHLDYSFLRGLLPRGRGFVPWLRAMIEARRRFGPFDDETPAGAEATEAARLAAAELLADGVTETWDVASYGLARLALAHSGLRAIHFAELIAPAPADWETRWADWRNEYDLLEPAGGGAYRLGVAPHTVYTVVPPALSEAARWAALRRLPLAIHLAESPDENELLLEGRGALADLLATAGGAPTGAGAAGRSAIERAADAGALGPATLAIHCNLLRPGEAERLAASGARVVFCPASHRFFGYPPYPLGEYRRAGVRLALGTDSLASNDRLSIRTEARILASLASDWPPAEVLGCATGHGLGDSPPYGPRGRLAPGLPAQWALWRLPESLGTTSAEAYLAAWLSPEAALDASHPGGAKSQPSPP